MKCLFFGTMFTEISECIDLMFSHYLVACKLWYSETSLTHWPLRYVMVILTHCGQVTTIWWQIWVYIGSGDGLLPDGTKPLPEPMLTYYQLGPLAFMWGHFHEKTRRYQSAKQDWRLHFGNCFRSPRGQWDIEACILKIASRSPRGQWVKLVFFKLNYKDRYLEHLLYNYHQVNAAKPHWWLVNFDSGNSLVPSGNKPLPEPMLA